MPRDQMAISTGVPEASIHPSLTGFQGMENMAPGAQFPIQIMNQDGDKGLRGMLWGLVPSYTSLSTKPNHFLMFNARSETIFEKPSFANIIKSRRGIVYMNGYYEWKKEAGIKQPYYVKSEENEYLRMACIYDTWNFSGDIMYSFSIVTCAADKSIAWLHNRQPLFLLTSEAEEIWTHPNSSHEAITEILHNSAFPGGLIVNPVTTKMSSMSYQDESCSKPIREQRKAISFFSKVSTKGVLKSALVKSVTSPSATTGINKNNITSPNNKRNRKECSPSKTLINYFCPNENAAKRYVFLVMYVYLRLRYSYILFRAG